MKKILFIAFALISFNVWSQPLIMGALNTKIQSGTVAPNGNVFGNATDLYLQRDNGIGKLWQKQTGLGNLTGWVQISGSGSITSLNNNLTLNGTIGQLGGTYIQNTTSDIDTFNHLWSGINVDNGDTNYFQINGSENAITVLSQNLGIVSGLALKTQYFQTYNLFPGSRTVQIQCDSSASLSREDAEGVAIIGTFNDVGNTQASEIIYQKKEGGGITRDVSRIYVQQHDIMMYANRWEDAYRYSKITMDSTQVLIETYPDSAGGNFIYSGKIQLLDTTYTMKLRTAVNHYTLWQANNDGAILKTTLANDSTQFVQNATSLRWLIRDGSANQSLIADNNGFAFSMTTGDFDIGTTTGFFYAPRMTAAQRDLASPSIGGMLYNTDTNKYQFWNGAAWETITSAP